MYISALIYKKKIIIGIKKSHTGATERDTPIVAVGGLTTLYHIHCTENSISDTAVYLHSALVRDAGEIGTPPVVVLNRLLTQLK